MEAAVEELTPLGVVKQLKVLGAWSEVWTCSRAGIVHSNLAGARDIERRAIPKDAMPAVPPPAWKLGFDKPCRSVNRACHTGGDRAKCTLELAVELRRANRDSLDSVQKFPHFRIRRGSMVRMALQVGSRVTAWAARFRRGRSARCCRKRGGRQIADQPEKHFPDFGVSRPLSGLRARLGTAQILGGFRTHGAVSVDVHSGTSHMWGAIASASPTLCLRSATLC